MNIRSTIALMWLVGSFANVLVAQERPTVGKRHMDFVLPKIEDRASVALSQFRGKKVILIHFASW